MKNPRHLVKRLAAVVVAFALILLAACTAVQMQSELELREDGTGSRTIRYLIAKNDHQDGNGSAYYYLKQHGEQLQQYLVDHYTEVVPGSEEWLNITVDDSAEDWEKVDMVFDFASFDEYVERMTALAYREDQAPEFVAPTLVENEDGTVTYTEKTAALITIGKSIHYDIMDDPDMFDEQSTKDGVALNDGSADLDSLRQYGTEIMKPEYGEAMTIKIGEGDPEVVMLSEDEYSYTANYSGEALPFDPNREPVRQLEYLFEDDLVNNAEMPESDLTLGVGSSLTEPEFREGVDGQGVYFDGTTYLASPNRTFNFDELTISFYFQMEEYTDTDTGANMVLVPAGLGALGPGVIDLEFIPDEGAPGTNFLAKMNSSDWQTQDKLFVEGFLMENHLEDWHHYAVVYENEYDEEGNILDSFVYIYIDGEQAAQSRLSVAAGLPFSLGMFDDGSLGDPSGGFNVGGYYEAETVKRGITGVLDNLVIYDGALSQEQVQSELYTVEVDDPYDPANVETDIEGSEPTEPEATEPEPTEPEATDAPTEAPTEAPTAAPTTTAPTTDTDRGTNNLIWWILGGLVVVLIAGALIVRSKKRQP